MSDTRRNVVVLLCDQLRPDFLSLYGCEAVPTPNLERLAERGVVFENAMTQSTVCAPARATMMTGRYVSDHGVWTNGVQFRDGIDVLPERMTEAGYATGAFGKLHHEPPWDTKGFQQAVLTEEGRLGEDDPYFQWLKGRHPEVEHLWNTDGYEFAFDEEEYHERWIADHAMSFIDQRAGSDQPFLAWVSFQGPHSPYDPPSEVKGAVDGDALPDPLERPEADLAEVARYRKARSGDFDDEEITARRTAYAEIMVEIDRQVGRILDRLEETGVFEETTILFSSDHGDLLGDFGLHAKGPFPYRGQMDVPMVVANHPEIEGGTRSERLAGVIDIPGTCLDIAGDEDGLGQSLSLVDLASGDPEYTRESLFCEFGDSIKTVYDGRYKYSYYPYTGESELYDRRTDPDELDDLSGGPDHADVERERLMAIVDFAVLGTGINVEAKDFVPTQQDGLRGKDPRYQEAFEVYHPLSSAARTAIREAGFDPDYNEFMRGKEVRNAPGSPYWET